MKSIVITSINPPTEAVRRFSKLNNYRLYVVGDKKSPEAYFQEGVHYLPIEDQLKLDFSIVDLLPENHYSRKMIGYLVAMQDGAKLIIDTDDDNIPYENYSFPELTSKSELLANATEANLGFINIYNLFSEQHIWPRGLPLKQILRNDSGLELAQSTYKIGVIQALADGDPDVDALYRLVINEPCIFDKNAPVILAENTWSPFNSQNTLFIQKFFYLLYLPTTVTFRYTDILRSYVAQVILWKFGYNLAFSEATVFQDRNVHDYLKDFESEVPMYLTVDNVMETLKEATISAEDVGLALVECYEALFKSGIVSENEIETVMAWVSDCSSLLK